MTIYKYSSRREFYQKVVLSNEHTVGSFKESKRYINITTPILTGKNNARIKKNP